MELRLPGDGQRLRCSHCGNLTRFDVERARTTREFWHVSLAGEPRVEQEEIVAETLVRISCRWCGAHDGVEVVERPDDEDRAGEAGLGGTP